FAVGVQMRTPGRQENGFHTTVLQQRIKRLRAFGVPIVDQMAFAQEEPIEGIGQLPGAWLHEGGRRMWGETGDLDPARRQLYHYEHVVCHEPMPGGYLHRAKGRGCKHLPVHLQELCPTHTGLTSLWSGLHMVAAQDVVHG